MKNALAVTVVAVAVACASPVRASIENAGTTAGNFLSVGAGAGALGMGGTALALPNGLLGAAWNPASLAHLDQTELMLSHAGLESQTSQEWVAVGGRLAATSTHWALSGLYNGQGSFEGRDATGLSTGSFGVSDMALGLHVARPFGPLVSAGVGAKYVSEVLGSTSGSGLTFDGGMQLHAGPAALGVAAQNLGGRMSYSGASFPFPSNVGIGGALVLPTGLRLGLDANFPKAYYNDVRAGIEWRYKGLVAMRVGYRKELAAPWDDPLTGPTFGFGGGMGAMWVDYGYVVPGQGAGQHRIGITLRPGIMRGAGLLGSQPPKPQPVAADAGKPSTPTPLAEAKPATPAPASTPAPPTLVTPTQAVSAPVAVGIVSAPAAKRARAPQPVPVAELAPAPALVRSVPVPDPPADLQGAMVAPKNAPAPSRVPALKPVAAVAPKPAAVAPKPAQPSSAGPLATTLAPPRAPKRVTPAVPSAPLPKPTDAPKPVSPAPSARAAVATPAPATPTLAPAPTSAPITVPTPAPSAPAPAALVAESKPRVAPATAPAMAPIVIQRPAKVKVQKGESLADIAKQWGTSTAAIMMENNLVTDRVKPGQELKLPKK